MQHLDTCDQIRVYNCKPIDLHRRNISSLRHRLNLTNLLVDHVILNGQIRLRRRRVLERTQLDKMVLTNLCHNVHNQSNCSLVGLRSRVACISKDLRKWKHASAINAAIRIRVHILQHYPHRLLINDPLL